MKQFFSILFALYFILITLGVSVDMHFCEQKLHKLSFHYFEDNHDEQMTCNSKHSSCCDMQGHHCDAQESSCCEDIHQLIKLDSVDYLYSSHTVDFKLSAIELLFDSLISEFDEGLHDLDLIVYHADDNYPPPYIQFQQLIIYA